METTFPEEKAHMNMPLPLFLATITVCVIAYFIFKEKFLGRRNLPPGPFRIPILGNLLQMVKNPHLKLSKWAQCYGNLYTIYMGTKPALVVNDPRLMKEIFGTAASTGKFKTDATLLISQGSYGILNTEGNAWAEQRQFCIRSLREFGGGRSMEPLILSDVKDVCDWIRGALYHIHHNLEIWGDPENFRPERFLLGDEGEALKEFLVPFQAGKRQCLGESLARDIIFLFFTKLFQQFNVTPDKHFLKKEYFTPDVSYNLVPKQLRLVMSAR